MAVGTVAAIKLRQKLIDNEALRNFRRRLRSERYERETRNSHGSRALDTVLVDALSGLANQAESFPLYQGLLREFCDNVRPVVARHASFVDAIRLVCEPENVLAYTIRWKTQHGEEQTNRAWRCNYSSVLGACRGGVRMHPSVTQDMVVALAFLVTLQNALSNLPLGGGFMGTDFDARNYCDADVQSFCFEFVHQICKDLPPDWPFDITCDLGCGPRECAMLDRAHTRYVSQARRLRDQAGIGSQTLPNASLYSSMTVVSPETTLEICSKPVAPKVVGRPYAVGIGVIQLGRLFCGLPSFDKTVCMISGAGDCALTVAKCLIEEGAAVITMSDSSGFILCPQGLTYVQWQRINQHRTHRVPLRDIVSEDGWITADSRPPVKASASRKGNKLITDGIRWYPGKVWEHGIRADYVFPCSHEHEIDVTEAEILINSTKPIGILEVSYSACTLNAQNHILAHKIKFAPSKVCSLAPMIALGMHLAEKMEKAQFEHEIKSYMTYVYNHVKSFYDGYYPDVYFKEAVDCAALMSLAKEMKARSMI